MRVRIISVGLFAATAVLVLWLNPIGRSVAGEDKQPTPPLGEHEFRGKILIVAVRTYGVPAGTEARVIEKASTRRLGDRTFVVGVVPDMGPGFELTKGRVVWFPVTEIVQITEYDTLDAVKKIVEQQLKPK